MAPLPSIMNQHPHKIPHTGAAIRFYWKCKCLKGLAPQNGHRSETANGEFQQSNFLRSVNQCWNFGLLTWRCGLWLPQKTIVSNHLSTG
jgi:hypothetical protein